jgi:hypothetical protein
MNEAERDREPIDDNHVSYKELLRMYDELVEEVSRLRTDLINLRAELNLMDE